MGNNKSRHQHQQNSSGQDYQKSSSSRYNGGVGAIGGQDRVRADKYMTNNINSSSTRQQQQYHNQQQQSPLLNDSGHYSIHGFMASPSSPIDRSDTPTMNGPSGGGGGGLGWNHPNLSSPSRLDQTKKTSDSSLHLQFQHGTRNNNNGKATTSGHPSGPSAGAGIGGAAGRLSGSTGVRISGTMPRIPTTTGQPVYDGLNDGYGVESNYYNNTTSQEMSSMTMHPSSQPTMYKQQQQQQQQGPDSKSLSIPPHHLLQANGRMSQQHHYPDHNNSNNHATSTGMRNSVTIPNTPYNNNNEEGMASSIAAMNLTDRQLQQQQQQNMRLQLQYPDRHQRDSFMPTYSLQPQPQQQQQQTHYQHPAAGISPTPLTVRNESYTKANGMDQLQQQQQQQQQQYDVHYAHHQDSTAYQAKQQQQQYYPQQQQPRLTNTYPAEPQRERVSVNNNTTIPKPSTFLANAGPLIDMGTSSSQRPPTADQVFARLARQYPTNPRETEKRERIYRWLGHIAESLTFNPDTDIPGFIIPVYPDELDHPDSPFYVDRITYELDLMAPIAKPFRKAIDINCASGDWAMDIAIKYPRTLVYALDSLLDTTHMPLRIPENCKFRIRDARDQEGEFDLVHQRLGAFRTPIQEWTPHFAEMRRLTRPGGWIQMAESDGMVVRAGLETTKVNRWVEQAALSSGLNPPQLMGALMPTVLGAGLINVECYDYSIPLGEWGGLRGQVAMRSYLEMVDSLKEEIIDMNRLEEGFFEETIELMKMECSDERAELIMRVICAQKPPVTDDLWRTAR
ncbi:hypothetical protein BGW39_004932 [Mortierella sp. 14UC]|nr:hypothetical protein BGW39_004932 [Mortierella sp. 14UC]